ncbi:MAG: hypothetical protein AAFV93_01545 [Chloroflexota bacterium]
MSVDRRVKRTRKALREALIQLMYEKDYDDIRMIDIAEVADIALRVRLTRLSTLITSSFRK